MLLELNKWLWDPVKDALILNCGYMWNMNMCWLPIPKLHGDVSKTPFVQWNKHAIYTFILGHMQHHLRFPCLCGQELEFLPQILFLSSCTSRNWPNLTNKAFFELLWISITCLTLWHDESKTNPAESWYKSLDLVHLSSFFMSFPFWVTYCYDMGRVYVHSQGPVDIWTREVLQFAWALSTETIERYSTKKIHIENTIIKPKNTSTATTWWVVFCGSEVYMGETCQLLIQLWPQNVTGKTNVKNSWQNPPKRNRSGKTAIWETNVEPS